MNFLCSIYIYLFLICFIFNILFTTQTYIEFDIKISINENEIDRFYIYTNNDICVEWTPSLFNPFLLVDRDTFIGEYESIDQSSFSIPSISMEEFRIMIYGNNTFINHFNVFLAKERFTSFIKGCYFGLSKGMGNYKELKENYTNLNLLKENNNINKRIFSFNKWVLNDNNIIKSSFYLGDIHEHFKLNDKNGIVGSCKITKNSMFWGCQFNQISYNSKIANLQNYNGDLYNIYFSSENHNIIIPKSFEDKFRDLTNNECKYDKFDIDEDKIHICCNFFKESDYTLIKLINDNMNITLEIDNTRRFSISNGERNKTRIRFKDIDYFIFPLIMFKNFHIQFDAENDIISFYTNNPSILQVKKENKKGGTKGSKGLTTFLIIISILILIALGFGVFLYIRKRKKDLSEINSLYYNKK